MIYFLNIKTLKLYYKNIFLGLIGFVLMHGFGTRLFLSWDKKMLVNCDFLSRNLDFFSCNSENCEMYKQTFELFSK